MRKFASVVCFVFTCVGVSTFAQEMGEDVVVSSEVSVSNEAQDNNGDVAPQGCDCGGGTGEKPKQ